MSRSPLDFPCPACRVPAGTYCDTPERDDALAAGQTPPVHRQRLAALAAVLRGDPVPDLPVLPYAGTSGWSGTDSSRDATMALDAAGITADSQRRAYEFVASRGPVGATVEETRNALGLHHGRTSGALSNLHGAGVLALLTERRNRARVYVLPRHVDDRPTTPKRRNSPKVDLPDPSDLEVMRRILGPFQPRESTADSVLPGRTVRIVVARGCQFVFGEDGRLVNLRALPD